MQGLIGLGIALGLSLAPTVMFLGLWRGLKRMQRGTVVQRAANRADVDDPTVSMGDAIDAVFNPSKSIFGDGDTSTTHSAGTCSACGEDNNETFDYCRTCSSRL